VTTVHELAVELDCRPDAVLEEVFGLCVAHREAAVIVAGDLCVALGQDTELTAFGAARVRSRLGASR